MRRYHFLSTEDVYEALNQLRSAFLAAKNGEEVNEIINGLFTHDEKMKIGRRIIIASLLDYSTVTDIVSISHVGRTTISLVSKLKDDNPKCFQLIGNRKKHAQKVYEDKKYRKVGGSTLIFKRNEYTGFKRKDVKR